MIAVQIYGSIGFSQYAPIDGTQLKLVLRKKKGTKQIGTSYLKTE